jgi:4-carboxymuconolactone decarboxylase
MLQSYLFLGFPRMLTAAECFQETFPEFVKKVKIKIPTPSQIENWMNSGTSLCQKVYAGNFEKLKSRLCLFSPEIFQWMILEGYGKVLSRPGLDVRDRELATVACLIIDDRPKQLFSHIRGALNVGVSRELLTAVIDDVSKVADAKSKRALSFLKKTEN